MSRAMNFDVTATDNASAEFLAMAQAAEKLEDKLRKLDGLKVEPKADLNITPATLKANQLKTRLDALKNVRATVEIDGAAAARVDVTALVVELRKIRDAKAKVQLDVGTARADVTAIAAKLASLNDKNVRVNVALAGTFTQDIARLHQRVSALSGSKVRIDFDIQPPDVEARLSSIAASLRALQGTTRHRVDVDTDGGTAAVAALSSGIGRMLKVGAGGLAIPGLISTVGQVGSLGASVMSLTGALGLLPAAGAVGAGAIGALTVGMQGFGDALAVRDDAEAFAQALDRLSPAARGAAVAVRDLGPAWTGLRLDVQERLFAGLGDTINRVSSAYLPSMRTGLGAIATELNTGAQGFATWATEGRTVADVDTILANTASTMRELAPAGTNVAAALTDVAVVGSTLMPELAAGATNATARFREFVAEARRTGELEQWIRGGISTLEQLGRIAGNTGGILGSVFSASEEAGYGFLSAVEQVTRELDVLLSSTAGRTALVDLFRESGDAVNAALPGLRDLGSAVLATTSAFAQSDGLERFAQWVSQTAGAISPLVAKLGELAGNAMGNLASGAGLAMAALAPLAGGAAGVLDALGPVPGAVLAAVVAFKTLGLATASVVGLGTAMAGTAALTGTLTAGITGSLAAGAAAQAGMTRLGGAVTALGRSLPVIGVGLVAAGFAIEQFTADFDGAVSKVLTGSQSMSQAIAEQAAIIDTNQIAWLGGLDAAGSYAAAQEQVVAQTEAAIAVMAPLEAAQARANIAQTAYGDALRDFGPTSSQAIAAAARLVTANENLAREQGAAAAAAMTHTESLQAQNDAMRSQISSAFAYEDAVRATAEAHQAAADALASSGRDSEAYRTTVTDLARAIDDQAAAASAQATALGGAEAGAAAYATEILRATDVSSGPGRDAFVRLAATMDTAGLAALTSAAQVSGLATEIITLPDGRTVTVVAAAERSQLDSVTSDLNALASQEFIGTVTITAFDGPFRDGLTQSITLANGATGTITLDGNNQPVSAVIGETKYTIDATTGVMTIDGNPAPGQANLTGLKVRVDQTTGVMTIDGRDGGVEALKGRLSLPSSSTHSVNPRDLATPVINSLNGKNTSSTHTIRVVQTGVAGAAAGALGRAAGAYATPRQFGAYAIPREFGAYAAPRRFAAADSVTAYARGGMRWMSAARAEVVPARHLRVIGDRMQGDEAFIPINQSARSRSILRLSAQRMGFDLAPRRMAASSPRPVAGAFAPQPAVNPMTEQMRQVMLEPRAAAGGSVPRIDLSAMLSRLDSLGAKFEAVAAAVQNARPTISQTINTVDPVEAGRSSALAIKLAHY